MATSHLVWIDMEMTGLDVDSDKILEVKKPLTLLIADLVLTFRFFIRSPAS